MAYGTCVTFYIHLASNYNSKEHNEDRPCLATALARSFYHDFDPGRSGA